MKFSQLLQKYHPRHSSYLNVELVEQLTLEEDYANSAVFAPTVVIARSHSFNIS